MIPAEFTSPLLHDLIGACWHRDSTKRVPFNDIVFRLHRLQAIAGDGYDPTVTSDDESWIGSPHMSPRSSFLRPLCKCSLTGIRCWKVKRHCCISSHSDTALGLS